MIHSDEEISDKLIRQPANFPQRGKFAYSSARSPLRGTMPARLRMASSSAYLTAVENVTVLDPHIPALIRLTLANSNFIMMSSLSINLEKG
jgi:hypothetical protein